MSDNIDLPSLSPCIWELLNRPANYVPVRCQECKGHGRFVSYCWSTAGDVVFCPPCDGAGILYIYLAPK